MELLTFLVIGLVTGLVMTHVAKIPSRGLFVDTIIGAFGAYTGLAVFALADISAGGTIGATTIAVVGALALHGLVKVLPSK